MDDEFDDYSRSSLSEASPDYTVERFIQDFDKYSSLKKPEGKVVRKLSMNELSIGKTLQRSSFASVYAVIVKSDPEKAYELKRIDSRFHSSESVYHECAFHLANETKILSCLDHPNVVSLHGVSSLSMTEAIRRKALFLVLDRTVSTLDNRLDEWFRADTGKLFQTKKNTGVRLHVGVGIAKGMEYLHSKRIMFRDLKPRTVGFNAQGCVQITNFSRARDVDVARGIGESLDASGSARYMAPEIMAGRYYDQKVDVYSFGILLWEILTLQKPFHTLMHIEQMKETVLRGKRPALNAIATGSLRTLVKECWVEDPTLRPTFSTIRAQLEEVVAEENKFKPPRSSPFFRKKQLAGKTEAAEKSSKTSRPGDMNDSFTALVRGSADDF